MKALSKPKGLTALALALLVGCAPVTVTGSWRDADYARPIKQALVVGIFEGPLDRRSLEDALAAELAKHGVKAVKSYTIMQGENMPDVETFRGDIQGVEADAVLVTRLVNVEKESYFVPSRAYTVPRPRYYRHLHTYYGYAYHTLYEPGYFVERTIVSLETALYDAATDRLVWTLATESFDPQNTKELVEPLSRLITERMKKEKLL